MTSSRYRCIVYNLMKRRFTTPEAARRAGLSRVTLQRWLRDGKIKKAPKPTLRNGHGVRLWSQSDIEQLRKLKERIYRKGRGRKKRKR